MTNFLTPLRLENTLVLVIDLQDKLLPAMRDTEACVAAARRMIEAANLLGLPVLVTEQYPAGLGHTCQAIREVLGAAQVVEKTKFSACVEGVVDQIHRHKRPNVVVVGIEAHVCVQQSVLDLLRMGQRPLVCADAVSSRRALDCDAALARMRQAGAVVTTTESVIFELLGEAGTDAFKKILKIVK